MRFRRALGRWLVPGAALVLALAAIGAVTHLQRRADASRRAQVELANVETELNALQGHPWSADVEAGGSPALARRLMRESERQIETSLDELRRTFPTPQLGGLDGPYRANVAALERVRSLVVQKRKELAGEVQAEARREHRRALDALDVASGAYALRASRSLSQATWGSAVVILLLLAAFGFFFHRSLRARSEREASRRFAASLIESTPDGILAFDREQRFTVWNPGMERITDLPVERVLSRSALDLSPLLHDGGELALWRSALDGETVSKPGLPYAIPATGRAGFCDIVYSPLHGERGEIIGGLAVVRDVTAAKTLEEQLRQAQKLEAVGQLAGGVAHDFNNMMSAVVGFSELVLARLEEGHPQRRHVEEIRRAGERASEMTHQLLAFSRKQMLQPRVLDLNAVVAEGDKLLRRLIGEDIELVSVLDPELGLIEADPGQLEQVLVNMAVNARDAIPEGGKLTIETANVELDGDYALRYLDVEPGPYVLLAVSDTGVGMDPETKARIFEPFFTTKEEGKGTGLGLATVHGIVKQSGGDIGVYSEPGRGTTFKIYLPRVPAPVEQPELGAARERPPRGSETILLVEDEELVRNLEREALEASGYTVLEAQSARHALEIAQAHQGAIDLLLTDVVMPELSGRELAELLAPQRPEMRILYASGYADDAIVRHGVLEPEIAFLPKPLTPGSLGRKVRDVLDAAHPR
jgi:PAS domain S-box-containing protein